MSTQSPFSIIPSVDFFLGLETCQKLEKDYSRHIVKDELKKAIETAKQNLSKGTALLADRDEIISFILQETEKNIVRALEPGLKPVINATGIVLHTGLGRAPLSAAARENLLRVMQGYANIELDLQSGKRGERNNHVNRLLCRLTGAEAALVTNNNAAAVLLALNSMAFGKESVISRGQLIEIGGSFRMPDVMEKSGAIMREVGTTNKTKLDDYEKAINANTGVIVVAHTSNYRIMGFTHEVELAELVRLAHAKKIPVLHDLGGGFIVDLQQWGLPYEPLVQDSVKAGVDVVTFSGDKVMGGPQSGILVGKKKWIDRIHANPLMRAVRCDKLIFAALEATLKIFFREKDLMKEHDALRLLTEDVQIVRGKAEKVLNLIDKEAKTKLAVEIKDSFAQAGSGALPLAKIPSVAVVLTPENGRTEELASRLRTGNPPVVGYLKKEALYLDMRTVFPEQIDALAGAINSSQ
jgi:L-seryl-tRNA(Ser) seleniumtransferase